MHHRFKTSKALTNFAIVFLILTILACKWGDDNKPGNNQKAVTTVILVRHAEKDTQPEGDPTLTQEGKERAEQLKRMLIDKNIKAIYTSKYRRTKETAKPLADELGITLTEINEAESIANSILKNNQGQAILIVGHSNTVPEIIKRLGGGAVDQIPETDFDNMFTVTISQDKSVNVVRTKY